MKKFWNVFVVSLVVLLIMVNMSWSRPERPGQIPNGNVNFCANCHINPGGGGPRNDFGKLIEAQFLTEPGAAGNVIWGALLASLDADNDGISNGEELQDPFGQWSEGEPQPGLSSLVTLPGDQKSNTFSKLTLQFSGMTPHVGQQLEIRIIDKANGKEVGREEVSAIPSSDFPVDLTVILPNHSYFVDFYADLNENSLYNPPPTDHAWRLDLDNVTGDTTLNFSHNTNFTDINWVYELNVRFTGMTPHIDQLLELRVMDQSNSSEVNRTRIEFIPDAAFEVNVSGIELGKSYTVDFYADLNKNGIYDPPPVDHAWLANFTSTDGDERIDFEHNTNFTDIGWNYLFTMNLLSMNPHVGQLFEMRLIEEGIEIGRIRLDSIIVPNFLLSIPGLSLSKGYQVDFYADLNKNGVYDSPPTDHAWRLEFNGTSGNVVENFSHNTNFTDIEWSTAIDLVPVAGVPEVFVLNQNYPNPFNPETHIKFELPITSKVKIEIFNILGQRLLVLLERDLTPGIYDITWDGRDAQGRALSSGVYIYRMTTANFQQVKRMLLMK